MQKLKKPVELDMVKSIIVCRLLRLVTYAVQCTALQYPVFLLCISVVTNHNHLLLIPAVTYGDGRLTDLFIFEALS